MQRARRALGVALLLCAGAACAAPRVLPVPEDDAQTVERAVHELVNQHRRAGQLGALQFNPDIAQLAREHSRRVARGIVPPGHAGFEAREQRLARRMPLRAVGENFAVLRHPSPALAERVLRLWLHSEGHRANLEGCYTATGVGAARDVDGTYYLTQLFVQAAAAESVCTAEARISSRRTHRARGAARSAPAPRSR